MLSFSVSEAMYEATLMMQFDTDSTFTPTPLGLSVKAITSGICLTSSNVDTVRAQN